MIQRLGLAEAVTEVAEQGQGLLVAGGGGRVVTGQLLHDPKIVEGPGLTEPVPEIAEQGQGLLVTGGGGRVVTGQLLDNP